MRRLLPAVVVATLLLPLLGRACSWDYDTLKMEQARFPDTLELITGKFLRHSPEFYRWRIADRLKRLEADPNNVRLLDDLAVAYDKVGEHDKAIATAERTERIQPGRYETAANLGTFLFHAGRLKDGLPHIDRALAINPNAHFGREKYQKLLVEYVLHQRTMRSAWDIRLPLPLACCTLRAPDPDSPEHEPGTMGVVVEHTFADFLGQGSVHIGMLSLLEDETTAAKKIAERKAENAAALKGVLGMMKFGDHKSPVLLEALGWLLISSANEQDAKRLSCRAFLKASYEVADGPARNAYRALAKWALFLQIAGPDRNRQITLAEVEAEFRPELADAKQWSEAIREKELASIREGKNPDEEFDKLYDAEPRVGGVQAGGEQRPGPDVFRVVGLVLVLAGAALVLGWLAVGRLRRAA